MSTWSMRINLERKKEQHFWKTKLQLKKKKERSSKGRKSRLLVIATQWNRSLRHKNTRCSFPWPQGAFHSQLVFSPLLSFQHFYYHCYFQWHFSGFHLRPKVKLFWKMWRKKEDRQDQITRQLWDPEKILAIFECFSFHDPDAFSKQKFQFATDLTLGSEAMWGVRIC